eukprot:symbB.v1.2.039499.t1/scaffold6608.1/size16736/1
MNNYGVIVNEIGMRPMITQFQQEFIWPIAKVLFPEEASQFDSHHSFIVRYTAAEDLGLDMHTDDSDITFNVCLGFDFTGATLTFCGYMGSADHRKASHVYHHEVGRAVLHLGSRRHGADDIESGTRMNLIVWSHNKAWRRAHPSRLRREYYSKEDGPPDQVCLSYTHDRDYLAYKKAPKGRAGGRNRPWCPPHGKEYENYPDSDDAIMPEDCNKLQALKEAGNSTKCYLQLLKLQLKSLIGVAEPDCLPDGNFAARQCWGSVDECWCADGTGKELEGTRGKPGPSLEECAAKLGGSPDCERCTVRHQQAAVNPLEDFIHGVGAFGLTMPKIERPSNTSMMPDGDEKDSDVRMWSPDTDRSEMRLDRKSTIEELQDKLHFALTELDETKGALDAAQKRVSELESAPEPRSLDVRIEIAKSTVAFLLVLAAEVTYFVVILQEKMAFGDENCTGITSVARRSCEVCGSGTLVMPVGGDYEKNWSDLARSIFYLFVLLWSFQGVGIICDEFMAAIEKITSSKRPKWITNRAGQKVKIHITVWNETLANLSLMALGWELLSCSSAPEILLSTVELCSQRFFAGSLGPQTVVGSASFNLFCISSVCISAIPHMDVRKIQKYQVFIFTCTSSVLAYLWMLVVIAGITPNVVEVWEGVVTLLFFFVFLGVAFTLDKSFSSVEDTDAVAVHQQLEARFCQPVSMEGVRAMLSKPSVTHETRNSRISAKGQLRRLSTGAKKQTDFLYGFADPEVVVNQMDETLTLRIEATNGAHPAP